MAAADLGTMEPAKEVARGEVARGAVAKGMAWEAAKEEVVMTVVTEAAAMAVGRTVEANGVALAAAREVVVWVVARAGTRGAGAKMVAAAHQEVAARVEVEVSQTPHSRDRGMWDRPCPLHRSVASRGKLWRYERGHQHTVVGLMEADSQAASAARAEAGRTIGD